MPSGWILNRKFIQDEQRYIQYTILTDLESRARIMQLMLEVKNDITAGSVVKSPKMLLLDEHKLSYESDTEVKLSPCGRYYSIEYI